MGGEDAAMKTSLLLLLCAICANAMPNRDLYTKTPFGHILTHCTHEVPENSHLVAQEDGSTKVLTEAGQQHVIPGTARCRCDCRGRCPLITMDGCNTLQSTCQSLVSLVVLTLSLI